MSDPTTQLSIDRGDGSPPPLSAEERRALLGQLLERRQGKPRVCPTSYAQRRLWFVCQLVRESWFYHSCPMMRLRGSLDRRLLQEALDALILRHESLRTSFQFDPESREPVQVIHAPQPALLECLDLPSDPRPDSASDPGPSPTTQCQADLDRLTRELIRRPFDLVEGPLFRAHLISVSKDEHTLLLVIHHLVFDGWSMKVLCRELTELYDAFAASRPARLPSLPIQYGDFAVLQRERLEGPALDELLGYWRQHLDSLPVLELPTDRARPPQPGHEGARASILLPSPLAEALDGLCADEGASLFMGVLAALAVVLQRYSGQEDIVVGAPIANRNRREIEGLIGCFINTLVLRTDCSGDPTFRELLGRVRDGCLAAFDRQDLPFEKLVEEMHPDRDLSRNPLYQVILDVQQGKRGSAAWQAGGVQFSLAEAQSNSVRFDLETTACRYAEGLLIQFNYQTELFEPITIQRMLDQFGLLLQTATEAPDRKISELPRLTADQWHRLLVDWNDTTQPYPRDQAVHEQFEAQAARTPEAIAVRSGDCSLTYRQLDDRANRLASALRQHGALPNTLVGLCVDRSVDLLVGMLGIFKAGGAYVPLDVTLPEARLDFMLQDTRAKMVVTQRALVSSLPSFDGQKICVDDEWPLADEPPLDSTSAVGGDHLAYVIYTSGSTGRPKGVQIGHRGVVNLLEAMRREPGFGPRDVLLAITAFSFDMSVVELLLPLVCGGTVVIASAEIVLDGRALQQQLERHEVTVMQATPATWQLLIQSGWTGRRDLKMLCGGEALSRALADALLDRGGELWNLYGPTEATVYAAGARIEPGSRPVTIGGPIANTRLYVLDPSGHPVPPGAVGELCIGGDGLAFGYLGQPELTAERFVATSMDAKPHARIYRTGDLVRLDANDCLSFLGRQDHQVKLRGYRIELSEIEATLQSHPGIAHSVAIVREDQPGDRRLVAYVVPRDSTVPAAGELRQFLARTLPEYMLPSALVELASLPLTSSGKVDRKALPSPELSGGASAAPPTTPMQMMLAEVWQEVLGVEAIGVDDNFFDLGGHSLLTIDVVRRMEERTGVQVGVAQLIMQSLGQIAGLYEQALAERSSNGAAKQTPSGPRRMLSALGRLLPSSAARRKS